MILLPEAALVVCAQPRFTLRVCEQCVSLSPLRPAPRSQGSQLPAPMNEIPGSASTFPASSRRQRGVLIAEHWESPVGHSSNSFSSSSTDVLIHLL